MTKPKRFAPSSKYVKYRDNTWIECRKRVYLYWYKFLQHAERDDRYTVDWKNYLSWGGREVVMDSKFDHWWEQHWKDCFGIDEHTGTCMYPVKGNPKADGIRYALLVYENSHRGSNWDIAIYLQKEETRKRYPVPSFTYAMEDLDTNGNMKWGMERKRSQDEESRTGYKIEEIDNTRGVYNDKVWQNQQDKRKVQSMVGRYKKQATKHLDSVSRGEF